MPLTPADIHNTAFKRPPIGKRGYDEEEVDAFLDEVEQELTRLIEDNRTLHDQIRRGGGAAPAAAPAGPSSAALAAELGDLTGQLERLQEARARAEQNARSMQAQLERARNAPPAAPPIPPSGDERTNRVLLMAQRTADEHMRDAQREAEELLAAAKDNSEQLTADAQVKAETIESDARRNHTDAMNRLVTERANMLDEIDRLDQLARGYQAALNDHVAQQLQELNSAPELPV